MGTGVSMFKKQLKKIIIKTIIKCILELRMIDTNYNDINQK